MRQLYRVLSRGSCFAFVLCRIGAFDLFYRFYACVGYSMSRAHFRSGLVLADNCRSSLSITDAVGRPRVVLK